MKRASSLWAAGLALLVCAAGAAYWYSLNYMKWNVPLYCLCMALLFLLGAAGFGLLAIAKGRTGKRLLRAALSGGLGTAAGILIVSYVINVILFHEGGARFASLATAVLSGALALYGVLRMKTLTRTRRAGRPLLGVLLALAVCAAGVAGTVVAGLGLSDRNDMEALRKAAAEELSAGEKRYGIDALRREDGALTVAFIGGSLTQGRVTYENGRPHSSNAWTDDVLQFLAEKYPRKTLRAVNAAKGGTNSQYGASRFGYDVEPYAPDLLFIEFSVNDSGSLSNETDDYGAARTQLYLEYMLRRCLKMQKEPVVIYLHTPYPTDTDTDLYRLWKAGADLKTTLCEHYGVPVIDIYETLHDAYGQSGTSLSLEDWLLENGWYNPAQDGGGLDVHPNPDGYRAFYSAAAVGALERNWDALIRQPDHAEIWCKDDAAYLNGTYSYVECADPRLSYSGGWHTYKNRLATWLAVSGDAVPEGFLEYPHFEKGVAQAKNRTGAYFTYETDADELGMAIVSSVNGLPATVLCEGKEVGELRCGSPYGNMEFPAGTVSLPGGGEKRRVTVNVGDPTQEAYLFRFGYLIEFRYGSSYMGDVG